MKHLSIGIIFAMWIATVFTSCRQGQKGDPGPAGTSSTTPPYKIGSIIGVLAGKTHTNDSAFTLPLNFKYFKETSDNAISVLSNYNVYSITRYDSTGNSYIKFDFSLNYYDPSIGRIASNSSTSRTTTMGPHINNTSVTVVSNRKLSTNKMFYFGTTTDIVNPMNVKAISLANYISGGNSGITYSNIAVDSTKGLISFDYSLELATSDNSTGNTATMNGNVSFTPYNVVYRQAAQ